MDRNYKERKRYKEFEEKSRRFVEYVRKLREKNHRSLIKMPHQRSNVRIRYESVSSETPKAYRILFEDGNETWFPKKLIKLDEGNQIVSMPEWLADERAILEFEAK